MFLALDYNSVLARRRKLRAWRGYEETPLDKGTTTTTTTTSSSSPPVARWYNTTDVYEQQRLHKESIIAKYAAAVELQTQRERPEKREGTVAGTTGGGQSQQQGGVGAMAAPTRPKGKRAQGAPTRSVRTLPLTSSVPSLPPLTSPNKQSLELK
eukprot:PhM_4_TR17770/c0_g1_i2/m.50989